MSRPSSAHRTSSGTNLPSRSNSHLSAGPPADAAKPDDEAITDVIDQVQSTGSIEAAARKLQLYAKMTGIDLTDPHTSNTGVHNARTGSASEEAKASSSKSIGRVQAPKPGQPGWYDPEEEEYQQRYSGNGNDDSALDDDDEDDEDADMEGGDEVNLEEIVHLQEIVEGLWVGDLVAAMDTEGLEERGIKNIVSLLRPRLSFSPEFSVFNLEIDDSQDTDILSHLPTCVQWIGEALRRRDQILSSQSSESERSESPEREPLIRKLPETKAGGVLVHCQAGMSRSATVTAAYLMIALGIDPIEAVEMIREKRPVVDPSETFWYQLGLFYNADGKVTLRDRSTRHFYMERTTNELMNTNAAGKVKTDKWAKYPATPTPSNPPTPAGGHGKRKIRCKMCRRLLAVREHMMDHILDQSPVSRPRTPSNFNLPSPRLSMSQMNEKSDSGTGTTSSGKSNPSSGEGSAGMERRGSHVSDIINPLTGLPGARSRHQSMSGERPTMSTQDSDEKIISPISALPSPTGSVPFPRPSAPGLILQALTPVDPTRSLTPTDEKSPPMMIDSPASMSRSNSLDNRSGSSSSVRRRATSTGTGSSLKNSSKPSDTVLKSPEQLNANLPPQLQALRMANTSSSPIPSPVGSSPATSPDKDKEKGDISNSSSLEKPRDQENMKTAARRMSMLALTPAGSLRERKGSQTSGMIGSGFGFGGELAMSGPPILVNPKCSGYFVEPLTWMEPVLANGEVSGKLICPNEKCGAKLGNFDWAGVQCGCKEWVTPGFCISRSKVDEVW